VALHFTGVDGKASSPSDFSGIVLVSKPAMFKARPIAFVSSFSNALSVDNSPKLDPVKNLSGRVISGITLAIK
jgi:hypothetical protein